MTKTANRIASLAPTKAVPERGRAMQSAVKKIAQPRRKENKSHEANDNTTIVSTAMEQTPKVPRRTGLRLHAARNGYVRVVPVISVLDIVTQGSEFLGYFVIVQ